MKKTIYILLAAFLIAACDDSETFYTTSYPVVRVEPYVTLQTTDPTPGEGGETQAAAEQTEDPLIQTISDDVLANAPVQAGGSYRLDFTVYNGGPLEVLPAPEAEVSTGEFVKQPGATELQFLYDGRDYTCVMSFYTDSADNVSKVLLTIDLTEHYQALYPDGNITRVLRREYTSQTRR